MQRLKDAPRTRKETLTEFRLSKRASVTIVEGCNQLIEYIKLNGIRWRRNLKAAGLQILSMAKSQLSIFQPQILRIGRQPS
jgi:hypothetical protein